VFDDVFGHRCHYLEARRDGRIVGVLPLVEFRSWLFGRFMVSLPFVNYGGILAADDEAAHALLAEATRLTTARNLRHLELRHRHQMFPSLPPRTHKVTMFLSLASDADGMWEKLDRKVRNQIRKAEKSGLETVVGGQELLPEFYDVFAENMRDLGTPVYSKRLFSQVTDLFPSDTCIVVVRHEGQPVAGGFGIGHHETVEVPWASSLRRHASLCPNMLLYWTLIKHAISERRQWFDFGRSSPDSGTYRFKEQWGARPEALCWEYVLPDGAAIPVQGPDNQKFGMAVRMWRRLPLPISRLVGPSLVRAIP
jgi:FemAB-related protein (PEP-CTERM system-associated)